MAQVVVLGAGIAGHTAALYLSKFLKKKDGHSVVVVSPRPTYNWIPSNIWVGTGKMDRKQVVYELDPIYRRVGVDFRQAFARTIFPEGTADNERPQVEIEYSDGPRKGEMERVEFDYLVNATGPKLNFGATEGLGPQTGNTVSVCTDLHAVKAWEKLQGIIERAKNGEKLRVVSGVGNGTCTCQGAAFEYTFNMDHELREAGVRDNVEVVYMTNEAELGDFGVGGMVFKQDGYETNSRLWTESIFRERDVHAITGAAPQKIEPGKITYENLDGETKELDFDMAMLLPPFTGQDLKAVNREGEDITSTVFNPAGFMKVDGDYSGKPYEEWDPEDWPRTYRNPTYPNMFAAGIAFAPPHQISKPRTNPNGTVITPAPPRTGMPSGVIARAVARSIAALIKEGPDAKMYPASMTEIGATCVASTGNSLMNGTAAAMVMDPIIPNRNRYSNKGHRNPKRTRGEIGLFGHWEKLMIHYLFVYKAHGRFGWSIIPE